MSELTPEARRQLDRYLASARSALRGSRTSADEVEASVREHVEVALAGAPGPVADITPILERLGPPDRWLPDEERPGWKLMMDRLQRGPEDWRLAYLSFTVFSLMIVTFPVGGVLLVIPSYLLSRAYVDFVRGRGEEMGGRRWLVYPPIAMLLALAAVAVLIMPIAGFFNMAAGEAVFEHASATRRAYEAGIAAAVAGPWWIVTATLLMMFLRPVQFVFAPLLDRLQRRHLAVLAGIGAVVGMAGAAVLYWR